MHFSASLFSFVLDAAGRHHGINLKISMRTGTNWFHLQRKLVWELVPTAFICKEVVSLAIWLYLHTSDCLQISFQACQSTFVFFLFKIQDSSNRQYTAEVQNTGPAVRLPKVYIPHLTWSTQLGPGGWPLSASVSSE